VGFNTGHFRLDGNKNYNQQWSIYLLEKSEDAIRFINRLREDWNLIQSLTGNWQNFDLWAEYMSSPSTIAERLREQIAPVVGL